MSADFEEHWTAGRSSQNEVGFCEDPILFYTDGLGPCIGVCIAWKSWAGILHTADIFMDEEDVVRELIQTAKKVIPAPIIPAICPLICGGDIQDPFAISDDPKRTLNVLFKPGQKRLKFLKKRGSGNHTSVGATVKRQPWWPDLKTPKCISSRTGKSLQSGRSYNSRDTERSTDDFKDKNAQVSRNEQCFELPITR